MSKTEDTQNEITDSLLDLFRLDPIRWFDTVSGWVGGFIGFVARMLGNSRD